MQCYQPITVVIFSGDFTLRLPVSPTLFIHFRKVKILVFCIFNIPLQSKSTVIKLLASQAHRTEVYGSTCFTDCSLSAAKSSAFVDSCDFEEKNICGMIQGLGNTKWEQRSSVSGGPHDDFSNMGQCTGDCQTL